VVVHFEDFLGGHNFFFDPFFVWEFQFNTDCSVVTWGSITFSFDIGD